MKRQHIKVVLGAIFFALLTITSNAYANPALLPKHDGYPNMPGEDMFRDGSTTATGETALQKSAEEKPSLKDQVRTARGEVPDEAPLYRPQLYRRGAGELPIVVGPNHVTGQRGVTENHIRKGPNLEPNWGRFSPGFDGYCPGCP